MIETQGKLLFMAFFTILIGLVLIQPISNQIELVKLSSGTVTNESVPLTATTATVVNESVTMDSSNVTALLANNHLTTLTGLENITGENLLGECNITLVTGNLSCNATNSNTIFANYTYNSFSTGQLTTQDEWLTFDACRNSTMTTILSGLHCNVTIATGEVRTVFDNFSDGSAFIDYTFTPDTFVRGAAERSLLDITRLFFALFVLLLGVGFAIAAFKQSGAM